MAVDNKQVARRLLEDVFSRGKLELIDELVDEKYEGHDPVAGKALGRTGYRELVQGYRAAFPDLKLEVNSIICEGALVATRWTATGTHRGPLFGMEPTGKSAVVTGIDLAEFRGGRLINDYTQWDALGLMRQLGLDNAAVPIGPRESTKEVETRPF